MSTRASILALVLSVLFATTASVGYADPPGTHRARTAAKAKRPRAKGRRKVRRAETREEASAPVRDEQPQKHTAGQPDKGLSDAQKLARDTAQGADAEIVKEGDTSVKVMKFSGLDIEGRLKSPQLLYFVTRVQAEFERPKLPHRSFMPELQRSTHSEPVR